MTVQTSYPLNIAASLAGQLADLTDYEVVSTTIETAAGADFGIAVSRGSEDRAAVIGGTAFIGVTVREINHEGTSAGVVRYAQKETASTLRRGNIYVVCPAGCSPGDLVKFNNTTGVIDSGTAGAGETQLDGCSWETTAAAGEIAKLRVFSSDTTAGS